MKLTLAVVQFNPARENVEKNIRKLNHLLSGLQADLIVLPELSNSGYLYESPVALRPFTEPQEGSGPFLQALQALATQTGGLIVSGYAESAGKDLFNSAAAVSAEGVLLNYRKTHLFDREKQLFQPGDTGFPVVAWQGVQIGMMICFDWIFPEAARTLALKGAQVIAHPANLVLPYCQDAMVTRSIENQVFTATANRIGTERLGETQLTFTGQSQITSPSGKVLFRGPTTKPAVHVMEIDPDLAQKKALNPHNDLFADRRPDLYKLS